MIFKIEGNQILKVEEVKTENQIAIIESHYDFLYKGFLIEETEIELKYQVKKFDIEKEEHLGTNESGEYCYINENIYPFANGKVVISKEV